MNENATRKKAELTPKQHAALVGLAAGKSPAVVAQDIGVHRSTIYRWLADPTFMAELRRLTAENMEHAMRRLATLADAAALTLADGMTKAQPINARIRAAVAVLENASRYVELIDILAQLEQFEKEKAQDGNAS